ncbi:MAG: 50S ribosomal protein L25 [Bacillota bacterium]
MSNQLEQLELVAEERTISGKHVKRLRQQGLVPAIMYGHNQPSVALQVNGAALQKLLRCGSNSIFLLKVANKPAVQAFIKKVQRNPVGGETIHVDFYQVTATEKLKTLVHLHFVNEAALGTLGGVTVLRSLSEVMVECLPADLPANIQVDLSGLTEAGAVIRVGNLQVGPAVTILADPNDMVAGLHQQARAEKAEEVDGNVPATESAP